MPRTRTKTEHFALGYPSSLPASQFPTNGDVINDLRWQFVHHGVPASRRKPPASFFSNTADQICEMWDNEGIPRYGLKYVKQKVRRLYRWSTTITKTPTASRGDNDAHVKKIRQVFDVSLCQCEVLTWDECTCPKSSKVPKEEWTFLQDQRGPRLLHLGGVDRPTSALRTTRQQRREKRTQWERSSSKR